MDYKDLTNGQFLELAKQYRSEGVTEVQWIFATMLGNACERIKQLQAENKKLRAEKRCNECPIRSDAESDVNNLRAENKLLDALLRRVQLGELDEEREIPQLPEYTTLEVESDE